MSIIWIIILIVIILYFYIKKKTIIYQQMADKEQFIDASTLGDTSGNTQQSTYSIWIYVKDWSIKYGQQKIIFKRSINSESPDLVVSLDKYEPNLNIQVKTMNTMNTYKTNYGSYISNNNVCPSPNTSGDFCIEYANTEDSDSLQTNCTKDHTCYAYSTVPGSSGLYVKNNSISYEDYPLNLLSFMNTTNVSGNTGAHYSYKTPGTFSVCNIPNIELQKWVNIILSINTDNIDVYINGDLTKSCNLDGIVNISNNTNVTISPENGFNGWNSKFEYWPKYINPKQAKHIFSQGHGASNDQNLKVNISLYEGDTQRANIVI